MKSILDLIEEGINTPPASSFKEELNRQCTSVIMPVFLLTIIVWIPYIFIDKKMFPGIPSLSYFRYGLSAVGGIAFILFSLPYFKKKAYELMIVIFLYLGVSTGAILGLVSANPIYMGGFALVILTFVLIPVQRNHALINMGITMMVFVIVGIQNRMAFVSEESIYGLLNLLVAVIIAATGFIILDNIRWRSYVKSILIQSTNEELKKTSNVLETTNRELNKANEIKDNLMQIAAHGLKDPLQVIILYADWLQEHFKNDPLALEKLGKINRNAEKMTSLVTEFLELALIESGKLHMYENTLSVGKTVEQVIGRMQPDAVKKNQKINLTIEKESTIVADEMLLQQIVENLVGNAVKFSPHGKTIDVSVTPTDSGSRITIKDEGPGFTADDKSKLFMKFQVLSAKPTGDEFSHGLGLAITRDLIYLHGGSIRLESEPGQGSIFTVELPHSPKSLIQNGTYSEPGEKI